MKKLLFATFLLAPAFAFSQTILRLTRVPATTPARDTLYVAGSFNDWNPASRTHRMERQPDNTYRLVLPPTVAGNLEFKITRGSWDKVETTAQNDEIANRRIAGAGKPRTLDLQVANWKDLAGGAKPCVSTAVQPNVQVLSNTFAMPQLGRTRRIWVYLPTGYSSASARRYPVLYLHDGQNVFDACTGFAGEWGVDETLRQLQQQDPANACIVVAVDNGGQDRLNELSPWRNPKYGGGQGEAYVDFLVQTLKPYVDAHYRTLTAREFTGIAGSSMGGLISVYAALQYPLAYSKVGVFSPAFWFAEDSLRHYMQGLRPRPSNCQTAYYYVAGAQEGETMVPLMQDFRLVLQRADSLATLSQLHVRPDGQHAEWFWRREFPAAFQWLQAQHTGSKGGQALRWAAWLEPGTRRLHFAADSAQAFKPAVRATLYNNAGKRVMRSKLLAGAAMDLRELPAGNYRLILQQLGHQSRGQQPARCQQLVVLPAIESGKQ